MRLSSSKSAYDFQEVLHMSNLPYNRSCAVDIFIYTCLQLSSKQPSVTDLSAVRLINSQRAAEV